MKDKKFYWLLAILVVIIIAGLLMILRGDEDAWLCQNGAWVKHGHPSAAKPSEPCGGQNSNPANENQNVGLANPASVNCEQKGGQLAIKAVDSGEIGVCEFADGSKCEEWAYFRNECQVGSKIVAYQPTANQEFRFPLKITGEARGNWFFEASFPVKLLDGNNQVIAQAAAQAKGDWMTDGFVPFEAELVGSILSQSGRIPVTLVLERDNPSGLAENDEKITIPVVLVQP